MYNVYSHLPDFTPEEAAHVKLPRNIEDAKSLGKVIFQYRDTVSVHHLHTLYNAKFIALLACAIYMDVCLCFYANFFNSRFNFLFHSRRIHVALVPGASADLHCLWNWCQFVLFTVQDCGTAPCQAICS